MMYASFDWLSLTGALSVKGARLEKSFHEPTFATPFPKADLRGNIQKEDRLRRWLILFLSLEAL